MKLSARNRFPGTILEVVRGATTAHVRVRLEGGAIVTASISNEAVDQLQLAESRKALAIVKASDVLIGVE